jgi:methylated-DNA-[protein]-cysteine S-methyltransferase
MDKVQHYLVFETANGFCGIAWNDIGITRFRLLDKTAEAAMRNLLRHLPDAEPGTPPQPVADAIAAAKRYFAGEKIDFSDVTVDLGEQDELFTRIYAAARRLGYGETTTYGTLAKQLGGDWEMARDVGQAMARSAASRPPAARIRKSVCWSWKAFALARRKRRSNRSAFN